LAAGVKVHSTRQNRTRRDQRGLQGIDNAGLKESGSRNNFANWEPAVSLQHGPVARGRLALRTH